LVANALLSRIRAETHRNVRRISDEAVSRLQSYDWPGNVRELENALMRAAIVARGTVIGSDHLMLGQEGRGEDEDLSLERAAQRHVRRVLRLVGGDEAAAAKRLGITKKSLKEHLTSD
jgi:DNA-binding NtrC family response regulator